MVTTKSGSYSSQGLQITINSYLKDPLLIPARMLNLAANQWIMESILRKAGTPAGGVVGYQESAPIFADSDPSILAEGAEIPLVTGSDGLPRAVWTTKLGAGIEITRETRTRNKTDVVERRMVQVTNTFVRAWELRMKAALDAAVASTGQVFNAYGTGTSGSNYWDDTTAPIRNQIIQASLLITEAMASTDPQQAQSPLGFIPDTLWMSVGNAARFIGNDQVNKLYLASPITGDAPLFKGTLPNEFMGLRIMRSRFLTDADIYMTQSKEVGGYADEYPYAITPMYEDKPRDSTWRSDATRRTAIFIDQPKAVLKIKTIHP
jgi:hypothetical protein